VIFSLQGFVKEKGAFRQAAYIIVLNVRLNEEREEASEEQTLNCSDNPDLNDFNYLDLSALRVARFTRPVDKLHMLCGYKLASTIKSCCILIPYLSSLHAKSELA
jgi:hypothetical protein